MCHTEILVRRIYVQDSMVTTHFCWSFNFQTVVSRVFQNEVAFSLFLKNCILELIDLSVIS